MRRAVVRSAGRRESSPAVARIAVAVAVAAASVAAAVAAAAVSARRVRCTLRRARAVGAKRRCLSSHGKIARFTVAIAISPSRAVLRAVVLLADRAGSRYDADYCKP